MNEINLTKDWLNIEYEGGGWDREAGLHISIDGSKEFLVECPILWGGRQWASFDVRAFRGKNAIVAAKSPGTFEWMQIFNTELADTPHNGAMQYQPRSFCREPDVTLPRPASGKFLLVPIKKAAPPVLCDFWDGDKLVFDLRMRLAFDGEPDFLASIPLEGFVAERVRFSSAESVVPANVYAKFTRHFAVAETYEPDSRPGHPADHFTAPYGGNGDMVGFYRYGGRYHMGFLHDYCYDLWNENCCWGHASSDDLIHWRMEKHYDRKGKGVKRTTGCIFVDNDNRSGLGDGNTPPILLFSCVEHSIAQRYQRHDKGDQTHPELIPKLELLYSTDGGENFVPYSRPVFQMQDIGGHDPEVVYYKPTDSFVMVIHDRRDHVWGFDFYTSKNLLDWEYASSVKGMCETPNFFPLRVDGIGEEKWVLMQCNMQYCIGSFDGRVFVPETSMADPLLAGAFAPRTFLTDDNRRILMAALLCVNPSGQGRGYCGHGGATHPVEVKLISGPDGLRLTAVELG